MDTPFINVNGECYEWAGSLFQSGYGRIKVEGKTYRAHRLAWEFAHGPIPEGKVIMHTCDNRKCVRINHLRLGTHQLNMADMVDKGRSAAGEKNFRAKLTVQQVEEIREKYQAGGTSQVTLAAEYSVSQGTISLLLRNKTWAGASPADSY